MSPAFFIVKMRIISTMVYHRIRISLKYGLRKYWQVLSINFAQEQTNTIAL